MESPQKASGDNLFTFQGSDQIDIKISFKTAVLGKADSACRG